MLKLTIIFFIKKISIIVPLIMFTAYWYIEYYVRLNHSVSGRLLGHTLSLSTPYYSSINIYTGIRVYLAP